MRKNVFGRQFKRDKNERKALFKGLMSSLILNDRIQTTEAKAKAIKGHVEKLVTKAKNGGIHIPRLLERDLIPSAIDKLIKDIAPRFKERPGGYTRILKLGNRLSDNARMALIEWVESDNSKFKVQNSKLEGAEVETKSIKGIKSINPDSIGIKSIKGKTEGNKKEEKKAKTNKKEKKESKK